MPFLEFILQAANLPKYLLSCIWPPAQIPITEKFDWETTSELRWGYGNIASSSKVLTTSRLGAPIPILSWVLKRYNNRLASASSNAEGSHRLVCDLCNKFQLLAVSPGPHITHQGCSVCIGKLPLVDPTLLVSFNPKI